MTVTFFLCPPINPWRARCFLFNKTLRAERYFTGHIEINLVETIFSAGQGSWWWLSMASKPYRLNSDLSYCQSLPDRRVVPLPLKAEKEHHVRFLKKLAENSFSVFQLLTGTGTSWGNIGISAELSCVNPQNLFISNVSRVHWKKRMKKSRITSQWNFFFFFTLSIWRLWFRLGFPLIVSYFSSLIFVLG